MTITQPRPRVYITDFITDGLSTEREILGDIAEVIALNAQGEQQLQGRLSDAACLMVYHFVSLRAATIAQLQSCKLIVRCGVGVDNVDWAFARKQGIAVANIPDYGTEDVADTAIAMMLSLARGVHFLNSRLRAAQGEWCYTQAVPVYRLRGRVFGIIGMGRIGTAAAHRAKSLGMRVAFYDPYVPDGWERAHGVSRADSLRDLLAQSNVLSLHCPSTKETENIIGAEQIAALPRGAFLINTARGVLVDTTAIPDAIRSGQLAGAAIDVLPMEPPDPASPLIAAWRNPADPCHHRVIINPHSAFYSEEGLNDIRVKASNACRRALLGQPLRNVVN